VRAVELNMRRGFANRQGDVVTAPRAARHA
jgi:hypothetical protein